MDLRRRIGVRTEAHSRELQRANELTASLTKQLRNHSVKLADWAKKLTDCESAKSLEVECRIRFEADCGRLQERLKLVKLEESQARAGKAEAAYRQLREETTDNLHLHVDQCLSGFVMWEIQTLKWLKLDLLERLLMGMKTNTVAGHKQLVRLVNSLSSRLEEARENL